MADGLVDRPFDNFRVAITDPTYFIGHQALLESVRRSPCQVRILLGGRRIGKTSLLRAVEWTLLKPATELATISLSGNQLAKESWVRKWLPTLSKVIPSPKAVPLAAPSPANSGAPKVSDRGAFPVFINFQLVAPTSLDNFRYLLIAQLREAINRWRQVPGAALREMYRQFLGQVASGGITLSFLNAINIKMDIRNPDHERKLNHEEFRAALLKTIHELQEWCFEGVCFLLDGAEFIVRQPWANDAWSYIRGLKDTDTALKPFVGFFLSGYRDLKEYQQAVGSPLLNIAQVEWLTSLTPVETQTLIQNRCQEEQIPLTEAEVQQILHWSCGHPFLLQQMLNLVFDAHRQNKNYSTTWLKLELLRQHDRDFSTWWDDSSRPYSFGKTERQVYRTLMRQPEATLEDMSKAAQLSYGEVADALDVLVGTGVVLRIDEESYRIGAQLFQEWVSQQKQEEISIE